MISVSEALKILSESKVDFGSKLLPLNESLGRYLMSDVIADRNLPPYHRVTMDGIAIHYETFKQGQKQFKIESISPAGSAKQTLKDQLQCIEVMTGTVLPAGTDTVIRYEDLDITDDHVRITIEDIRYQQNVHFEGEDKRAGEVVVPKGTYINASAVGIAASVGQQMVSVAKLPKVMLISTGDELVDIHQMPLPHQIRRSNIYRIAAALKKMQIKVDQDHLIDDKKTIQDKIKLYLSNYDVIMLSGGVSKGKYDFLPEVLDNLGVRKKFHKIKQKPGKPFWFGEYQDGACTVFALPGNPVSSFLCMEKYFKYWLTWCSTGKAPRKVYAKLAEEVRYAPALTLYQEVALETNEHAELIAQPLRGNGSGDMSNLVAASGFIQLPAEHEIHQAGEVFEVILF